MVTDVEMKSDSLPQKKSKTSYELPWIEKHRPRLVKSSLTIDRFAGDLKFTILFKMTKIRVVSRIHLLNYLNMQTKKLNLCPMFVLYE